MGKVKTNHIIRQNGFFDKIRTLRFERPQRFLILKKVPFRRVIWLVSFKIHVSGPSTALVDFVYVPQCQGHRVVLDAKHHRCSL